jgi:hypothetical protein
VVAPFVTATLPDPTTSVNAALIHGFDDIGFIQSATVDDTNENVPKTTDPDRVGGTVVINGFPIVVPCNTVIQMPATSGTGSRSTAPARYSTCRTHRTQPVRTSPGRWTHGHVV